MEHPSWNRLFYIHDAISLGVPITSIQKLTGIDRWFLEQIHDVVKTENEIRRYSVDNIPQELIKIAKEKGFSDTQLAWLMGGNTTEEDVYNKRRALGIKRVYKMVDTCSAEFPSPTNYYYYTFEEETESASSEKKKIIVLGSGPNRIGQGIEFDYSCVHGIL